MYIYVEILAYLNFLYFFLLAQMKGNDIEEAKQEEILHQICDKNVYEAISRLNLVNRNKCVAVRERVLDYFNKHRCIIKDDIYKRLIADMEASADVIVQRRSNFYDLEDFEGIDDI
ncbi:hypothetical protein PAEPH01_0808 [Pancytospora epiphaga]|nr:hypothetical protein PAEPH01_0808 [Pancytospora epiphaga]